MFSITNYESNTESPKHIKTDLLTNMSVVLTFFPQVLMKRFQKIGYSSDIINKVSADQPVKRRVPLPVPLS